MFKLRKSFLLIVLFIIFDPAFAVRIYVIEKGHPDYQEIMYSLSTVGGLGKKTFLKVQYDENILDSAQYVSGTTPADLAKICATSALGINEKKFDVKKFETSAFDLLSMHKFPFKVFDTKGASLRKKSSASSRIGAKKESYEEKIDESQAIFSKGSSIEDHIQYMSPKPKLSLSNIPPLEIWYYSTKGMEIECVSNLINDQSLSHKMLATRSDANEGKLLAFVFTQQSSRVESKESVIEAYTYDNRTQEQQYLEEKFFRASYLSSNLTSSSSSTTTTVTDEPATAAVELSSSTASSL
jgi:hypothetical protein